MTLFPWAYGYLPEIRTCSTVCLFNNLFILEVKATGARCEPTPPPGLRIAHGPTSHPSSRHWRRWYDINDPIFGSQGENRILIIFGSLWGLALAVRNLSTRDSAKLFFLWGQKLVVYLHVWKVLRYQTAPCALATVQLWNNRPKHVGFSTGKKHFASRDPSHHYDSQNCTGFIA